MAIRFICSLMNGVSHMLPFVVGGGILIAHCIPDRWTLCRYDMH